MPSAITIVKSVQNGRYTYELDQEALEKIFLNPKIKDMKVAVISVAGAFRKGKSFLLNFFVLYLNWLSTPFSSRRKEWFSDGNQLSCFPWKGGSKADTNGILMWSDPFILRDKDGDEVAVLLMDTQGAFDNNSTVADCATIFALSTMISSLQIYNISSDIQEDYLQHLRLFIEYGSLALKQTNKKPFQTLLFLIRDWTKDYEHEYGFGGGEEYLRETLKKTQTQKPELRELRNKIGSNFERLLCFLLPHPGLEVASSPDLENIGQISETFKEYILQLVPSLFSSKYLVTKEINGQKITTGQLMHYIKAYMDVFNSDTLPEPMTVLQATGEANHTMAASAAKMYYEMEMQPVMNSDILNINLLLELHEKAEDKAVRKFEETPKMGDEELTKKHREILKEHIKTRYCEFANIVRERARLAKEDAEQKKAYEELEKKIIEQERRREEQHKELEEQKRQMQREIAEQERRAAELTGVARRNAEEQARILKDAQRELNEQMRAFEEQRKKADREGREQRDRARREEEERCDRRRREEEERRLQRERDQHPITTVAIIAGEVIAAPAVVLKSAYDKIKSIFN